VSSFVFLRENEIRTTLAAHVTKTSHAPTSQHCAFLFCVFLPIICPVY
jgi:hypothetical protein